MANNNLLMENSNSIFFENDYVKIAIAKNNGEVLSLYNKMTNEEALDKCEVPYFTYLTKEDKIIKPSAVKILDGKLNVTYENGIVADYVIEVMKDYFSITLDTEITGDFDGIIICQLQTNAPWELDNPDAFGLSAVPMTTTVEVFALPGGASKLAKGATYTFLGVELKGSKLGVVFSRMTEHREHLKSLVNDIDPAKGITSTHGGPYTYDCHDIFGDYVIINRGLTPDTIDDTIELCRKYSIDQIDMHQDGGTFAHADFHFWCAETPEEKENNIFVPASVFKERVGEKVTKKGVQLSLHTYSSLVPFWGERTLGTPKWVNQIVTCPDTWTLRDDISESCNNIKTLEDATNIEFIPEQDVPYGNVHTKCLLIDNEIVLFSAPTNEGFPNVTRGVFGTKAEPHKKGTVIKQLYGWFGMFQPIPLSELFYEIAIRTANSYNDGGYEMIYLDGLESFAHIGLCDMRMKYYIYAEFVRAVLANCKIDPIIEFSSFPPNLWAARGRGGAVDAARRCYKKQKALHMKSQSNFLNCFYTATAGWFNYNPDSDERYKDAGIRTLYRDDLDFMGSLALAYNFGTVCERFSSGLFKADKRLADNFMYYGTYTHLRKANYFSPEVKKALLDGNEHKVFKKEDGSWAFKEMSYFRNKVHNVQDSDFTKLENNNPYAEQKPFIRIEQRYAAENVDGLKIFSFDETKPVTEYVGDHEILANAKEKILFKIKVHGNGSKSDAVLISLSGPKNIVESGRYDYFVPVNFEGWKEITLIEANNEDYDGYLFDGIQVGETFFNQSYRAKMHYQKLLNLKVSICGECKGVMLGEMTAYIPQDAPAKSPKITVGENSITFDAELHSTDYIEYYPEENKAYLNYYTHIFEDGNWKSDNFNVKEISFTGSVSIPNGNFEYSFEETPSTKLAPRAQVVFGVSGKIIENPKSWNTPDIDMPEDIEKVKTF